MHVCLQELRSSSVWSYSLHLASFSTNVTQRRTTRGDLLFSLGLDRSRSLARAGPLSDWRKTKKSKSMTIYIMCTISTCVCDMHESRVLSFDLSKKSNAIMLGRPLAVK